VLYFARFLMGLYVRALHMTLLLVAYEILIFYELMLISYHNDMSWCLYVYIEHLMEL